MFQGQLTDDKMLSDPFTHSPEPDSEFYSDSDLRIEDIVPIDHVAVIISNEGMADPQGAR